jgi:hypothetical protein
MTTQKRNLMAAIVLAAFVFGFGAFYITQQKARTDNAAAIAAIGEEFEESGITTQENYIRIRSISSALRASGKISDADLDWLLTVLQSSDQPLLHSRVLGVLTLLKQGSASQNQKIHRAIQPYLKSSNPLQREYALSVQKGLPSK